MKKLIKRKLNPKQELFCQLYSSDREFYGNGVEAYAEAYGLDIKNPRTYKVAQVSASHQLSKVIICNRINELLEDGGLNDQFVDKQLKMLITQHEDKHVKLASIREYNKLKKRITEKFEGKIETKLTITEILDNLEKAN